MSFSHRLAYVLVMLWTCPLSGQSLTLGPTSTGPQIVSVRLIATGEPLQSPGSSFGAGIVIGRDGNHILAVTALHVINGDDGREHRIVVGAGPEEDRVPGEVVISDSVEDLAVIRFQYAPWVADGSWTSAAPRMLDVLFQPVRGARVFALGCSMGACWAPPLEGRIARATDRQIYVRIPYPTDGVSGGALVDERGMIIGVFAGLDDVGLQSVRPWPFVLGWLYYASIPVNIPRRRLEQTGQLWGEIQFAGPLPSYPAWRPDSSRTLPPHGFDIGYRIHPNFDFTLGYRYLTTSERTRADQLPDGFTGSYRSIGVRYTRPFPVAFRDTPPMMTFVGVSYLGFSNAHVYRLEALPDSFDLRTGEQAYHLIDSYLPNYGGWSATAGFRLYLYRGMGIRGSFSMINLNLPLEHDRFRRHSFIELGTVLSLKDPIFFYEEDE